MRRTHLILERMEDLPTLPVVASQAMAVAEDPDASAEDLLRVIQVDPSLALKVLRVANSAYFRRGAGVSDLKTAIVNLGHQNVRNLVLGVSVVNLFDDAFFETDFTREGFWRHSISVATMAGAIAETRPEISAQTAFVCGLLHDVGKLVLDRYMRDEFVYLLKLCKRENISFADAEKRTMNINHAGIGGELLKVWGFPEELVQPVRWHHVPALCDAEYQPYACIVNMADYLSVEAGIGTSGTAVPKKPPVLTLEYIDLPAETLEVMTEWLEQEPLTATLMPRGF